VPMIKEANVGIGLYGNEGMSASQNADFAVGEFRFIWRLLFAHGRTFYINDTLNAFYYFYKNILLTVPQFMFAFVCGFSGQSIFDDVYISFYNAFITTWPVAGKVLFDMDINPKTDDAQLVNQLPLLYFESQQGLNFFQANFFKCILHAISHACFIFFLPYFIMDSKAITRENGQTADQWTMSLTMFYSLFLVVTMNLLINLKQHTVYNLFALVVMSIAPLSLTVSLSNYKAESWMHNVIHTTHASPSFHAAWFITVGCCSLIDFLILVKSFLYKPAMPEFLRRLRKEGRSLDEPQVKEQWEELIEDRKRYMHELELIHETIVNKKREQKELAFLKQQREPPEAEPEPQ